MSARDSSKTHLRSAQRRMVAALGVACVLAFGACNDEDLQRALSGEAATSGTLLGVLAQVQTASGSMGALAAGQQPSGSASALTLALTPGSTAVTNGGTATIDVSSAAAFNELTVGVAGLEAYYRIMLPAMVTSETLQLTIDQDIMQSPVTFTVVASDGMDLGPVAQSTFTIIFVGTGDVQVSLTFDQLDDVDLAVMDPNGDRVFFGNRTVPSGGTLDLDANPVCSEPVGNSENITWPQGTAPDGMYSVFVTLFQNCGSAGVNWTITVFALGSPPEVFSGTLLPGDVGSDQLVTTFMVGSTP